MPQSEHTLKGFAARLVDSGLLEPQAAQLAEQEANEAGESLLLHIIAHGLVTARDATLAAAWEYGLPYVDLDALRIDSLPSIDELPEKVLRKLGVLPLYRREHRLTVGVPSPSTLTHLDELQFATGLSIESVLVAADQLTPALEQYLEAGEESAMDMLSEDGEALDGLDFEGEEDNNNDLAITASSDDAPVVRFVHKVLLDAIKRGASDIHFEPYESTYRIRFRIDGMLVENTRPPFNMRNRISARLKVMSRMDISERRLPQDGAIKLRLSKSRSIDFRVNTLPTVYGEKLVLRILDPSSAKMGIEALGFEPEQRAMFEKTLDQPQGMILVTGPTGSGKTVTLYTGLNILNTPERNISTAEDPVELKVEGVNQVNVLPKIGLDFASALRAFLRQDPDVVMVGEIRDKETAEIAVKAAQTGHLVLSTLHTNSAPETLTRLSNMGIAPFNIASSVSLIIAQRLARRLCTHCRQPAEIPPEAMASMGFSEDNGFSAAELEAATIFRPVGCSQCTLGYKGRVGIYEVMPISDEMSRLIMREGTAIELADQARKEGLSDLRRSGLRKVMSGMTSLEEVNRITKD
ncbi:MAG: type IV-A pilus assembly ATPase PilB [Cobetia sp.]|jgi:type IV pilus assembly protein PilB|uniref:type IV-A pilus assembly ATPase PilB n=1 Tax=Cobetia TaxID=204286 RepID=UPI000C423957|nr:MULTISPECIES: type IV-A pilus assembly ATPase PilB [Cobetia]MBK08082.1 type IV-A pilus assembly ATPase PilB [Cobetia sp.]UBU49401.1 type IV-A pilus assembly ATPase PilB [Cobetia amphilecti]HBJ26529.1 type IV-A pilus assembly ATPase PilB [Cobetia sp.]|tara:strand:- start:35634 stop:37370 length:1737 start_codon:yes stop_codon:yes gene_type:complete